MSIQNYEIDLITVSKLYFQIIMSSFCQARNTHWIQARINTKQDQDLQKKQWSIVCQNHHILSQTFKPLGILHDKKPATIKIHCPIPARKAIIIRKQKYF